MCTLFLFCLEMYFLPFPCMFLSFFLLFSHSLRNDDFYYFYFSYRAKLTAYNQLYTKIYFTQYLFILFQCLYYLLFFCINAFTTFSLQLIVCVCSLTSLLGLLLACLRYGHCVCVYFVGLFVICIYFSGSCQGLVAKGFELK